MSPMSRKPPSAAMIPRAILRIDFICASPPSRSASASACSPLRACGAARRRRGLVAGEDLRPSRGRRARRRSAPRRRARGDLRRVRVGELFGLVLGFAAERLRHHPRVGGLGCVTATPSAISRPGPLGAQRFDPAVQLVPAEVPAAGEEEGRAAQRPQEQRPPPGHRRTFLQRFPFRILGFFVWVFLPGEFREPPLRREMAFLDRQGPLDERRFSAPHPRFLVELAQHRPVSVLARLRHG